MYPCGRLAESQARADSRFVELVPVTAMDPLTRETQALLHAHQNPAECKQAKFAVWKMYDSGFGCDVHTLAWALSYAVSLDRVLVYHPTA
jgi:hypothetical protein